MDDDKRPSGDDLDDPLFSIGAPNCPRCLLPMELTGRGILRCADCGLAKL